MMSRGKLPLRDRLLTAILAWCFDRLGPVARARVVAAIPLVERNRIRLSKEQT